MKSFGKRYQPLVEKLKDRSNESTSLCRLKVCKEKQYWWYNGRIFSSFLLIHIFCGYLYRMQCSMKLEAERQLNQNVPFTSHVTLKSYLAWLFVDIFQLNKCVSSSNIYWIHKHYNYLKILKYCIFFTLCQNQITVCA